MELRRTINRHLDSAEKPRIWEVNNSRIHAGFALVQNLQNETLQLSLLCRPVNPRLE